MDGCSTDATGSDRRVVAAPPLDARHIPLPEAHGSAIIGSFSGGIRERSASFGHSAGRLRGRAERRGSRSSAGASSFSSFHQQNTDSSPVCSPLGRHDVTDRALSCNK
ncbi:hypothetical protein GWI33_000254 [Rhynchophorus ferrugineus]|uniref:Uncharacterized protein n=1 Tax=Rhynchophorus ferrugineus TaxID=354439 RepID=A0A834J3P2_RHYFE|nr:hypothetical protein GWI33_000254 [Rhynchophorus ferrugineus]